MKLKPKGRVPSLLAWGLLVGGVALLMTFPGGIAPTGSFGLREIPAGILYVLAGLVFGLTHPEDRAWTGGPLLGWVPIVAGVVLAVDGSRLPAVTWLALVVLPALLATAGAWLGATIARRRSGAL